MPPVPKWALDFGATPWVGHACQKQPSTNAATRTGRKREVRAARQAAAIAESGTQEQAAET